MSEGKKETIAVWFSCGAASAVAAKKTIEKYGQTHNVIIVNNPVVTRKFFNEKYLSKSTPSGKVK